MRVTPPTRLESAFRQTRVRLRTAITRAWHTSEIDCLTGKRPELREMRRAIRPKSLAGRAAPKGVRRKQTAARSSNQEVIQHLSRSQIFKDYERAFSEAMGLPLNIRA